MRSQKWNHRKRSRKGRSQGLNNVKALGPCVVAKGLTHLLTLGNNIKKLRQYCAILYFIDHIPARPARLRRRLRRRYNSALRFSPTNFSVRNGYLQFLVLFLHSSLRESHSKLTNGEVSTFVYWTSHNHTYCFGRKSPDTSCSLEY